MDPRGEEGRRGGCGSVPKSTFFSGGGGSDPKSLPKPSSISKGAPRRRFKSMVPASVLAEAAAAPRKGGVWPALQLLPELCWQPQDVWHGSWASSPPQLVKFAALLVSGPCSGLMCKNVAQTVPRSVVMQTGHTLPLPEAQRPAEGRSLQQSHNRAGEATLTANLAPVGSFPTTSSALPPSSPKDPWTNNG